MPHWQESLAAVHTQHPEVEYESSGQAAYDDAGHDPVAD